MKKAMLVALFAAALAGAQPLPKLIGQRLEAVVPHRIFDNLNYTVNGGTVTLFGQVTDPALKASAAMTVAKVKGVDTVVNQLEVLPDSVVDNDIRAGVYANLLQQALDPVHIIVENQHVTLMGTVRTPMDKTLAQFAALRVPLVAGVTNDLIAG